MAWCPDINDVDHRAMLANQHPTQKTVVGQ